MSEREIEAAAKVICCGNLPCGGCSPEQYAKATRIATAALAAAAAVRSGPPESVEAETRRCWRIVNRAISTVGYGAGREQMIGVRDAIMAGPEGEAAIRSGPTVTVETLGKWQLGDRVRKTHGSSWQGRVVGFYSTKHTPLGYCIESEREPGSVQIYPSGALGPVPPTSQEHQTT